MCQYLRELIRISGYKPGTSNIDIFHFHGLVRHLTKKELTRLENETNAEWDDRIGKILQGCIAEGIVKKDMYNAILVDEGQDFTVEWMKGLIQLLNEDTDSLLFCYDPTQNVFGRKSITWKDADFKVQGKKPIELEVSYRTTIDFSMDL